MTKQNTHVGMGPPPREVKEEGPRDILNAFGGAYRGIWRLVDDARLTRSDDNQDWPEYVYLPLPEAGVCIAQWMVTNGHTDKLHPSKVVEPASWLAGFAAWRISQGIYRFDETLYNALLATPLEGQLPVEVLTRLPEWCIYVETPGQTVAVSGGGSIPMLGVWVWIDRVRGSHDVLTLMMHCAAQGVLPVGHIPLIGTLDEALALVETEWQEASNRGNASNRPPEQYATIARATFGPLLSLLLYLCADQADYPRPDPPKPKKTKRGWRLFAADKLRTWTVGVRLGHALRRAQEAAEPGAASVADTGNAAIADRHRPRAHVRRSHWHTVVSGKGSKADPTKAKRTLRWFPPIPVNVDDLDDLPAVVHPVREK